MSATLPPRAARRGLSEAAYLKELEAGRRWKQRNPAKAGAHSYTACPLCGQPMGRSGARCAECRRAADRASTQTRRERIAELWREGRSCAEIAAAVGSTRASIQVEITRMRQAGWELPYRYPAVARRHAYERAA